MTDILSDSDAERLADAIFRLAREPYEKVRMNLPNIRELQLAHKVKELLSRQRWVPVSERLPKDNDIVRIKTVEGDILRARFYDGDWEVRVSGGANTSWLRGHWVESWLLPQPPEPPKEGL